MLSRSHMVLFVVGRSFETLVKCSVWINDCPLGVRFVAKATGFSRLMSSSDEVSHVAG